MKTLKIVALIGIALVALFILIGLFSKPAESVDAGSPALDPLAADTSAVAVIPGMKPVDVYLSLENRGFKVEKNFKAKPMSWTCTQTTPSLSYHVDVVGPKAGETELVRASVTATGAKTALAGQDFMAFVASVPYTGADPASARTWVLQHFDQDGASTVIGGARFTLKAPTELYRMLLIEAAQ